VTRPRLRSRKNKRPQNYCEDAKMKKKGFNRQTRLSTKLWWRELTLEKKAFSECINTSCARWRRKKRTATQRIRGLFFLGEG